MVVFLSTAFNALMCNRKVNAISDIFTDVCCIQGYHELSARRGSHSVVGEIC